MSSLRLMRASSYAGIIPVAVALLACSTFKDDAPCGGADCSDAGVDATSPDAAVAASGDATIDAEVDARVDAEADAAPDVTIDASAPFGSPILSGFGDVDTQTGHAQQRHIVYASKSARFYLFYLDAAQQTKLKVRSSADFVNWREEPSLDLAIDHGNEGRNFSVATAVLGGVDVFHAIIALHPLLKTPDAHRTYHLRARVVSGAFAWTGNTPLTNLENELGPKVAADVGCDPDGPDVTITPNGVVADATGWQAWPSTMCDANVFVSPTPDPGGATWLPSFPFKPYYFPVTTTSKAHSLTSLPTGDIVALFGNGSANPDPDDVGWSRSRDAGIDADGADANAVSWPPRREVFPQATQSLNDWSSCLLPDGTLHSVRRTTADTFEHELYDGASWIHGGTIPAAPGLHGSGVTLVSKGAKMTLFALGADGSVQLVEWSAGAWGAQWKTALPAGEKRAWLSGTGCGGEGAVIWTEGSAGAERVMGGRVE